MKYTIEDIKKYVPDMEKVKIKVPDYISNMEKKELVKYGAIAGAATVVAIVSGIVIAKKLKSRKNVKVIEVNPCDLDK
ncbi:MAG: hypothetical protein IJC89_01115 [Clostridia bacterium]|nr:hypothetical protein [Clostridia bacterium]